LGLIPALDIEGLSALTSKRWPMGIGAGRPRAIASTGDPVWNVELAWLDDRRLAERSVRIGDNPVQRREVYHWTAERLDRIEIFDEDPDEGPVEELRWTWSGDRPIEVRHERGPGRSEGPVEAWRWSDDGRRLEIVEAARQRVIVRREVALDEHGRMRRSVSEWDGARIVVECEWSSDGRLVLARELGAPGSTGEHVIRFRWDDGGHLVAQSDDQRGGADTWRYAYETTS